MAHMRQRKARPVGELPLELTPMGAEQVEFGDDSIVAQVRLTFSFR